jgi:hypothetical protein
VPDEDHVVEVVDCENELVDVVFEGNSWICPIAAARQANAGDANLVSLELGQEVTPAPWSAPGAVDQNEDWIFHSTSPF